MSSFFSISGGGELGDRRRIAVIGAGIVGVCCANYLLSSGFDVTVVDPLEPGSPQQCSYGNAGSVAPGSCVPNALPGIVRSLPDLIFGENGPISLRLLDLPHAMPWLLRFLWASRRNRVEEIADAMIALNRLTLSCYQPLVKEAGCQDLIRVRGQLFVYEDPKGPDNASFSTKLRRDRGVKVDILNEKQLRELEPAIGPAYKSAVYLPDNGQCANPGKLNASLWQLAASKGARFVVGECQGFIQENGSVVAAALTSGLRINADQFVVCAGASSLSLAKQIGVTVPLIGERGYHVMIEDAGVGLRIQTSSASRKFSAAPMENGLRLAGTVEFAPPSAAPRWNRVELLLRQGQHMFPTLRITGNRKWVGSRPSLPDSIPIIERTSTFSNVILAFGHGHQGLIGGSVTGKLVAEIAQNRSTSINISPYKSARFKRVRPRHAAEQRLRQSSRQSK